MSEKRDHAQIFCHSRPPESFVIWHPGAIVAIQTTSCPARTRASTAAPGKFSSARKRMSHCGKNLLGVQQVASVVQASRDVFPGQAGIIRKNVGFDIFVGPQADYKLNR